MKRILEKVISLSRKEWSLKFDEALWDYRTTFNTPIDMSSYRIVFGKTSHIPFELKHKTYWAIQNLNFETKACGEKRLLQLNEPD